MNNINMEALNTARKLRANVKEQDYMLQVERSTEKNSKNTERKDINLAHYTSTSEIPVTYAVPRWSGHTLFAGSSLWIGMGCER